MKRERIFRFIGEGVQIPSEEKLKKEAEEKKLEPTTIDRLRNDGNVLEPQSGER